MKAGLPFISLHPDFPIDRQELMSKESKLCGIITETDLLGYQKLLFFLLLLCPFAFISGQTATVTGIILDEENNPLPDVHITCGNFGTYSDTTGFYLLLVSSDKARKISPEMPLRTMPSE